MNESRLKVTVMKAFTAPYRKTRGWRWCSGTCLWKMRVKTCKFACHCTAMANAEPLIACCFYSCGPRLGAFARTSRAAEVERFSSYYSEYRFGSLSRTSALRDNISPSPTLT